MKRSPATALEHLFRIRERTAGVDGGESLDVPSRHGRHRAADLATKVGLGDMLGRNVRRLSHGERQRVSVCRALVSQPGLILADEPTGNLDPSNKGRVLEILLNYARSAGATLVTVTHDHDLLDRFDSVVDLRPDDRGITAVYRAVPAGSDPKGNGQP